MIKRKTALFVLLAGFLVVSLVGAGCSQSETEEAVEEEDQAVETTEGTAVKTDTTDSTEKTDTTTDKKVEWKLVSGDPSDTCSAPTYEGEVEVNGWYVYDYSYVEKTWLLQIIDEDVSKIPVKEVYGEESYNQWVEKPQFLFDATAEQVEELKQASKDKPMKVTIKAFRAYCEGAPQLSQSGFDNIWQ
ncbi:MAG: hypothetical protein ABII72_00290 [Parcubacteria group bacterium]